jgi:histidinol-phosphate aminotransferase
VTPAEPRPGLRETRPYASPQPDVAIRLNTNECPYPLPEGFVEHLQEAVRALTLNRYPDREAVRLREALSAHTAHPVEGTWAASGSNEIIQQLLLAYGGPGRTSLVFSPTYELHSRLTWVTHTEIAEVPMEAPWLLGRQHVAEAAQAQPSVVFVCSPNNPTGNAQPVEQVERLASSLDALVIVDEAYIEFGGRSALGLWREHPNVVVVRTMSKAFALAGARLGYCLAAPEVIDDLRRVRLPYHLSALAQAAALTALQHTEDAMSILDAVRGERERLSAELSRIPGVTPYPSDANFVLFRPHADAGEVWRALLERGVLVRDVSAAVPGCLRVTAGTPDEVDGFLSALKEVV